MLVQRDALDSFDVIVFDEFDEVVVGINIGSVIVVVVGS